MAVLTPAWKMAKLVLSKISAQTPVLYRHGFICPAFHFQN